MNQLAIDRYEEKAHGGTAARPLRGCMGNRAPVARNQSQTSAANSSRPRQLGRHRVGRFFSHGLDELHITALTRAGLSEAVAAAVLADHSQASGAVQGNSDLPEVRHLSKSSPRARSQRDRP